MMSKTMFTVRKKVQKLSKGTKTLNPHVPDVARIWADSRPMLQMILEMREANGDTTTLVCPS